LTSVKRSQELLANSQLQELQREVKLKSDKMRVMQDKIERLEAAAMVE
jgi:hypothetical protein